MLHYTSLPGSIHFSEKSTGIHAMVEDTVQLIENRRVYAVMLAGTATLGGGSPASERA